jgi:hypothetical protein
VAALGEAYRQAGARRTARRLLLRGLLRRLGRPSVPEGREEEALDSLLRSAPVGRRESAAALEEEWRKEDRTDLVALSRRVDRLLSETGRG